MEAVREQLPRAFYAFFGDTARLTSIQEQAIPLIAAGNNVLAVSPTGSGKTSAVVAPVAERALDFPEETYCVYICPTRALVNDIERRIKGPFEKLGMKVGVRHGDRRTMRGKSLPNILITTPESLDVMLSSNTGDYERLKGVRVVIIDEAHQFYQTHRGYQLILLLERVKRATGRSLQRLVMSATVATPAKVAEWFKGSDAQFEAVQVRGSRQVDVFLDHLTAANGEIFKKGDVVREIVAPVLKKHRKVLLFANSRSECDWLYWKLHEYLPVQTLLHYSTLDKEYREAVERTFQKAERALCIATSTLELGIDIGDIDAIIMYGAPASVSSFVQRVGRGNRRSDRVEVYGWCREYHVDGTRRGAEHDLVMFCALVAAMLESELEERPHAELFSVYVQQLFSLTRRYDSVVQEVLYRLVSEAETQPFATEKDIERILGHLAAADFYRYDEHDRAYFPRKKWEDVKTRLQLWGNLPARSYDLVIDNTETVPISEVPKGKTHRGDVFLFAGQPRVVTDVVGGVVKTVPLLASNPRLMSYETAGAATPRLVANKMRWILGTRPFPDLPIEMDGSLRDLMKAHRQRLRDVAWVQEVPFQRIGTSFCYYTFGGSWANELLAFTLRKQRVGVQVDSWRIITNRQIPSLGSLPCSIVKLEELVKDNLDALVERIQFSYHFAQLPDDLRLREVCSLLGLGEISDWFKELSVKKMVELE